MNQCAHSTRVFKNRNARRERVLQKMANMRAAKERKRLTNPIQDEPKFIRWFPLEFGVRDRITGETAWIELRSVRDAARRLAVLLKFYQPGIPT